MALAAHFPILFLAEFRRTIRLRWSYRLNTVAWIILWAVAFPLLMVTFESVSDSYGSEQQAASLIGFLMWDWCMAVLGATTGAVVTEAREGTLENVVLASFSPLLTFSIRVLTTALVSGMQTLILGAILSLQSNIEVPITSAGLTVILITVLGVGGVGLGLGGLALTHKSTESIVGLFSLLALVMTGALVPLEGLGVVFQVLRVLVPTTWGIDALREVAIGGVGWEGLLANGTWVGLALQAMVFVVIGLVVFEMCLLRVRQSGALGEY